MKKLKLTLLDWINLVLIIVGLILIIRRHFLLPHSIGIDISSISSIVSTPELIFSIGSLMSIFSFISKRRTLGILALLILIPSIILAAATPPPPPIFVHLDANPPSDLKRGSVNVSELKRIEIMYTATEGTHFHYRITTSHNSPTDCVGEWSYGKGLRTEVVTLGEIGPPKEELWFSACLWEVGMDWEYRLRGHVKKVGSSDYTVTVNLEAVRRVDWIDLVTKSVLLPLLVAIIGTMASAYLIHKKGRESMTRRLALFLLIALALPYFHSVQADLYVQPTSISIDAWPDEGLRDFQVNVTAIGGDTNITMRCLGDYVSPDQQNASLSAGEQGKKVKVSPASPEFFEGEYLAYKSGTVSGNFWFPDTIHASHPSSLA